MFEQFIVSFHFSHFFISFSIVTKILVTIISPIGGALISPILSKK